jgi:hypothetical protein
MAAAASRTGITKRKRGKMRDVEIRDVGILGTQIFGLTCNLVTPVGSKEGPGIQGYIYEVVLG